MKRPKTPAPSKPRRERVAVIADCHLGNFAQFGGEMKDGLNSRGALALDVFKNAITAAQEHGAKMLVIAGDLFHTRRPEPAVIANVVKVLAKYAQDIPVVILPGNHDMLDARALGGNTAVEPLCEEATVINEPTWVDAAHDLALLLVPFEAGRKMESVLEEAMRVDYEGTATKRILITHAGLYDNDSPSWARGRDACGVAFVQETLASSGFAAGYFGHFHKHTRWQKNERGEADVVQIGTLAPSGFGDAGFFPDVGTMLFVDGYETTAMEIHGPRFTVAKPGHDWTGAQKAEGSTVYVRAIAASDGPHLVIPPGIPPEHVDGVEPIKPEVLASSVKDVTDAWEAIEAFVRKLPLPAGLTADSVLKATREAWEAAE